MPVADATPDFEATADRNDRVFSARTPQPGTAGPLTPGEIATVLDITSNAASIRLYRARERLREVLRKIEDDDGHERVDEGRKS